MFNMRSCIDRCKHQRIGTFLYKNREYHFFNKNADISAREWMIRNFHDYWIKEFRDKTWSFSYALEEDYLYITSFCVYNVKKEYAFRVERIGTPINRVGSQGSSCLHKDTIDIYQKCRILFPFTGVIECSNFIRKVPSKKLEFKKGILIFKGRCEEDEKTI